MPRARGARSGGAIARAERAWGECALDARTTLRRRGVRGDLRNLDEIASGRRGHAVPQGLVSFAMGLSASGLPLLEIESRVVAAALSMVRAACNEGAADGPHAA